MNSEDTPAQDTETRRVRKKSKFREAVETVLMVIAAALLLKAFVVEAFRIPSGSMANTLIEGDFLFVNKFIYGIKTPRYIPFTNIKIPRIHLPPFRHPRIGDVIVFVYPGDRDEVEPREIQSYVKRCAAIAGDTLEIVNKRVFVNGREISNPEHVKLEPITSGPPGFANPRIFPKGAPFNEDNYGPIRIPKKGEVMELTPDNLKAWRVFIEREGHRVETRGRDILIDGKVTTSYQVEQNYLFMIGDNRDNSLDSRFWGFLPEENIVGQALLIYWSWNQNLPLASADKFRSVRWARVGTIVR
jgi:signal peptidase I